MNKRRELRLKVCNNDTLSKLEKRYNIIIQQNNFSYISDLLSHEINRHPLNLGVMVPFGVCKAKDKTLRQQGIKGKDIEKEMNLALENGEFQMYLQPKVVIATTDVVGAEALVRWKHPKRGIVPPHDFTPFFEKNSFIVKLDYFIWEKAFKTIRLWLDKGYPVIPISVNVSRIHLENTRFIERLLGLAKKYHVPPKMIELELTETAFFDRTYEIKNLLNQLKSYGFIIALDDFGSGYSSLNLLKDIPVDIIKLDRNFLSETTGEEKRQTVIKYIISMAKKLHIHVIAEGVENFVQAEFLYHLGCETAQGYFYSSPIAIDDFEQYAFNPIKE